VQSRFDYGAWDVAHCRRCGLGFARPLLSDEELRAIYTEEYFDGRFTETQNYLENGDNRPLWDVTLDWIERRTGRGRLLDVGCGCGFFLRSAAEHGWEATGFDASAWAADHVRTTYGLNAYTGTLDGVPLPVGHFDVITLWSTLEHVTDPITTLQQVRGFLRPGGMVCIGVPNYRGWSVKLKGAKESNFKREHLYYFSGRSLRRALTDAGFEHAQRMLIFGGGASSTAGSLAQYLLRRFGVSNQLMLAARRPLR